MIVFHWKRHDRGSHGIMWTLHDSAQRELGRCFFLSGSKHWRCSAGAPVKGGIVLTDYFAGNAQAARRRLERDWCKRSIGLFGEDDIDFVTEDAGAPAVTVCVSF